MSPRPTTPKLRWLAGTLIAGAVTATALTSGGADPASGERAEPNRAKRGTKLKIERNEFGPVVVNGAGKAVYVFTAERTRKPRCYGVCARAWPPVLAKGRPRAGKGIKRRWIRTVRRRSGKRQLLYRGRPLYYYQHDTASLTLCHDVFEFGGTWLVIRRSGKRAP